jgi:hypothetical protein
VLTNIYSGSVLVVLIALIEIYIDLFSNCANRVTPISILLFYKTFSCKSLNLYKDNAIGALREEVITRLLIYNLYWIKGVDLTSKVGYFYSG